MRTASVLLKPRDWSVRQGAGAKRAPLPADLSNVTSTHTPSNRPHPSRLPNPKPRLAQANAQFNFHVHSGLVLHGVVGLVQIGQQAQAKALHIGIGLDARFVFVKANVGVQPGHAHIHTGLAVDIAGVAAHKLGLQQHVFR